MYAQLKQHLRTVVSLLIVTVAVTLAMLVTGTVEPFSAWTWTDILGEGLSATLIFMWFLMVLAARPRGRVTATLSFGLAALFVGMHVDTLDEVIAMPSSMSWYTFAEPIATLTGFGVITAGIFMWHHEQLLINRLMSGREIASREHDQFDALTPLHRASYFRSHALQFASTLRASGESCVLLAIDLVDFRSINERYGFDEGDRILRSVGQLLVMNLRRGDLVCREAGDRFSALLPSTSMHEADVLADQLRVAVGACALRTESCGSVVGLRLRVRACALTADATLDTLSSLHRRRGSGSVPA